MTHTDTGTYGAKRMSFDAPNPRDLLKRLKDENPRANEARLLKLFTEAVQDDSDYLPAVIGYWFANNYRSLVQDKMRPYAQLGAAIRKVETTKRVEHIKRQIVAKALTLDFEIDGKALGDHTGAEVKKLGGWLGKIAKKVGARQTVRSVLKDDRALAAALK